MNEFKHVSVLLNEVIENLKIKPNGIYVDGTLGGAGHAYEICKRLDGEGRLIGIDQDRDAIGFAEERLNVFKGKVIIVRDNYSNYLSIMKQLGIRKADGILLDLGVSSYQLDTKERGFSYMEEAPLDMRMDDRNEKSAKDIVNGYTEVELYRIIRDYGEDRFAKNIAKHIVNARKIKTIETTKELARIIEAAIPAKFKVKSGHPAKRAFQAVRIECNRELEVLKCSLSGMVDSLSSGGRICVITFHSLEDRIVKNAFRECENPCTCPSSFPVCICGKKPLGKIISKKPILPLEEEVFHNKRAKSAKLRVFERL